MFFGQRDGGDETEAAAVAQCAGGDAAAMLLLLLLLLLGLYRRSRTDANVKNRKITLLPNR
jgi:MYXO-CTERM domain-containing protein